jgi:hypothetical protein
MAQIHQLIFSEKGACIEIDKDGLDLLDNLLLIK